MKERKREILKRVDETWRIKERRSVSLQRKEKKRERDRVGHQQT